MPHYDIKIDEDGAITIAGKGFEKSGCVKSGDMQKILASFRIDKKEVMNTKTKNRLKTKE